MGCTVHGNVVFVEGGLADCSVSGLVGRSVDFSVGDLVCGSVGRTEGSTVGG